MSEEEKVTAPAWVASQAVPESVPPKSKRTRRTKAQMAEVRASQPPKTIEVVPSDTNMIYEREAHGLSVRPFFRWFDIWIGIYVNTASRAIYFCPLPMVGIKITY